jgi:phosphate transport system substrate-binding protein
VTAADRSPRPRPARSGPRRLAAGALVAVATAGSLAVGVVAAGPAQAAVRMNGGGSTYVALAMNQWVADGNRQGLAMTYQPSSSPGGITLYQSNQIDFTGTEAEISSITNGSEGGFGRSFQYVPDVAGATAIMYNIKDSAGRKVDYLHLSRRTTAAIFVGAITRWNDPQIRRENLNVKLADIPIRPVYRGSPSGTTALFYDFVRSAAPDLWPAFLSRQGLQENGRRILSIPNGLGPNGVSLATSDQIAQYIANDSTGSGAIGYDEFGYAKAFGVNAAWIQNQAGKWVQPYAVNISAALEKARLRPDLSQELSGVYTNTNPLTYPISAYSYMMTPCAPSGDRPTCAAPFYSADRISAMAQWLRYIACDGQVKMAQLGYSPLPANLSQEIARSIGRLGPGAPRYAFTAANCRNPRFRGSLGAGAASPPDPFARADPTRYNGGGSASGGSAAGGSTPGGGSAAGGATSGRTGSGGSTAGGPAGRSGAGGTAGQRPSGSTSAPGVVGRAGSTQQAGGGSTEFRAAQPVSYPGADTPPLGSTPALVLLVLVTVPPIVLAWRRRRRRDS